MDDFKLERQIKRADYSSSKSLEKAKFTVINVLKIRSCAGCPGDGALWHTGMGYKHGRSRIRASRGNQLLT
jgi:hypothetical protein